MPISVFNRRIQSVENNSDKYPTAQPVKKPVLIPKSDWILLSKMADDEVYIRPRTAKGNRERYIHYCLICSNQIASIDRRMRKKINKMHMDRVGCMCTSCCQIMSAIHSNCSNTNKLKRLKFNLDICVTSMIRNIITCKVSVLTCYLPQFFQLEDINMDTLTIAPSNPKAIIFIPNSETEKVISIAIHPVHNSQPINYVNWLKASINKNSSPNDKIIQAEEQIIETEGSIIQPEESTMLSMYNLSSNNHRSILPPLNLTRTPRFLPSIPNNSNSNSSNNNSSNGMRSNNFKRASKLM